MLNVLKFEFCLKKSVQSQVMSAIKYCCVESCKSSSKKYKINFHSFPCNEIIKSKWLKNIFNVNVIDTRICNTDNLYVCAKHFEDSNYLSKNTKKLKRDSVPTLLLKEIDNDSITPVNSPVPVAPSPKCSSLKTENLQKECFPWRFDVEIENLNNLFSDSVADHCCCSDKVSLLYTIQHLKQQLHDIKQNYAQLHEEHEQLLKANTRDDHVNHEKSKAEKCIAKIERDASNSNPLATFILEQVYNYCLTKPNWSESTVRQCIAWRYVSPKGYEFAKRSHIVKAPNRTTLNKYIEKFKVDQELQNLIVTRLKTEAETL